MPNVPTPAVQSTEEATFNTYEAVAEALGYDASFSKPYRGDEFSMDFVDDRMSGLFPEAVSTSEKECRIMPVCQDAPPYPANINAAGQSGPPTIADFGGRRYRQTPDSAINQAADARHSTSSCTLALLTEKRHPRRWKCCVGTFGKQLCTNSYVGFTLWPFHRQDIIL